MRPKPALPLTALVHCQYGRSNRCAKYSRPHHPFPVRSDRSERLVMVYAGEVIWSKGIHANKHYAAKWDGVFIMCRNGRAAMTDLAAMLLCGRTPRPHDSGRTASCDTAAAECRGSALRCCHAFALPCWCCKAADVYQVHFSHFWSEFQVLHGECIWSRQLQHNSAQHRRSMGVIGAPGMPHPEQQPLSACGPFGLAFELLWTFLKYSSKLN
jgi:hypothetical protein